MPDLLIARDPIPGGRLPYLLSLPVAGEAPLILACAEVWPGAKDVFCHPLSSWPPDAQLLETLPVEQCWRVGKAVHLVLQRRQRRRSLFVWTVKGERQLIFWRSQRGISHVAIYAGKNSQGVPMMYECAPSYEKRGSSYGTHLTPVSYQGTPSHYGRIP